LGVALLTDSNTERSACWGVSVALAELLAGVRVELVGVADGRGVVSACPLLATKAVMLSVCGTLVLTVPTVHTPLPLV